jgi:3alpha(or 20beta)-hydroxysteroid dehydrogenase
VTGAAKGIGAATARLLVAEAGNVLVCDVLDERGEAVAAELGPQAAYAHLDVTSPSDWQKAVALAGERFGQLDVLVNNAGIAIPGTIEDSPLEDYYQTVAVNQTGVWLGLRAAIPALRAAGGGSIVNISSTAGMVSSPENGAYAATKWAVRGLTKTAATEFGRDGVRVNSVHPGLTNTDLAPVLGFEDGGIEYGKTWSPLGRMGQPQDVANVVLFLASDESAHCTGGEFIVDGGVLVGPGRRRNLQ